MSADDDSPAAMIGFGGGGLIAVVVAASTDASLLVLFAVGFLSAMLISGLVELLLTQTRRHR